MDLIKKMTEKKSEKGERFKQMQEDDRLQTMLEERKKSANRRELERYYREQEEQRIKEQLDIIRKRRNKETWQGNSFLGKKSSILRNERPILKEKNIFKGNKKSMMKGECMFFK